MEGAHHDDWGVAPAPNPPLASMHTEAARGNLDAVQRLVESENPVRRKKLLESTDEFGDTPIIKACRRGHIEVTSFLLEQGANIDARNEDGYTALMLACYWEQLPVVDLLLRHGADAGLTSNNGRTCYDTARTEKVRSLLARGSAPPGAPPSSARKSSPLPHSDVRSPFVAARAEPTWVPSASRSMLAPEIHPAFGDITARLDRTFDGVSNVGRSLNAARSSGAVAPSDPITAPAPVAAPSSSIFRPSDFALPDFRAALGPSTEKTAARFTTVPQGRMDLGLPPAVATVVSELLAQLGPSAARDDDWLSELRESYALLQQGQIQAREYDTRKAATLGRLKYLRPTPAQMSERAAMRRNVEALPLLLPQPPASIPPPLWKRLVVLTKAVRRAVSHDFLARWRGFVVTTVQHKNCIAVIRRRTLVRLLLCWREAATWQLTCKRLLARGIARRGSRIQQVMSEGFYRWADMGATRRRAADAELLDALAHLRSENAALQSKLARKEAVQSGSESEAAAAVAELEAMVADAQGLTPVLQEQVDLLKQALALEQDRSCRAESAVAQSETVLQETVTKYENELRRVRAGPAAPGWSDAADEGRVGTPASEEFDALNASFQEGVNHAQEEAHEALVAAREMSGALVKAEDALREEILRRERAEALAAETVAQKDSELRHLADKLSDANSLRRTCESLQRKLQNMEDDHRIAMETASRLHTEQEQELRTEAAAATKRTELKVATAASEQAVLQQQVRQLQSELNEANNRAAMTEQVLLRSAAAEAAEVGADIEGVTENLKFLLRNTGDAAEPQRKMLAAQKAAAIAPTKQVRRLESQVQELEKQLGSSETARQLLAEETSSAKSTCTQLRRALKSCHDTVTKEQKRAAAAARAHAEERSRLQKEIMDLRKARDSLKAQLDQAESTQSSLARRAKLAEEETARAKRSVERVSTASEKSTLVRGDAAATKASRDSVRVLASDSLRREAEHKLATQTLQLRTVEKDCEELSTKLASTAARLSACEAELRGAKQDTAVADVARQAAAELAEERAAEVASLRRLLSAIPAIDDQLPTPSATPPAGEREEEMDGTEDDADYASKDPLLRALRRPDTDPTPTESEEPERNHTAGARPHDSKDTGAVPLGLIERLQKARSAVQPSNGPPRGAPQSGHTQQTTVNAAEKENYRPPAAVSPAAGTAKLRSGTKIPAPASPPAERQPNAVPQTNSGGSSSASISDFREKKGKLVVGLRDFDGMSSEEDRSDSDEPACENEKKQASADLGDQDTSRRSSLSCATGGDGAISDSSLADYIQSDNDYDRSPSPSSFLNGELFSPADISKQRRASRDGTRSSTGSSFASASFVSAQEMQTYAGSESERSPPQERVAFSAPKIDADSSITPNDSLGNVSFATNTTFAPEGDFEVDVTFEEPGSLGIVFGNFGKHDTVLIKEITPGYQASHETRLKPGMKLKQVDGQPIAHLSFYQALELVKAASRPVTLSFVDTELPTIGATLGVSATTSGMGASSSSAVSATYLEESSSVYSTDRSQLSTLSDSTHTHTDRDQDRPDGDEAQWGQKAIGWLQDTAKAVGPSVAAGVGVGIAAWSEQL